MDFREECFKYLSMAHPDLGESEIRQMTNDLVAKIEKQPNEITMRAMPRENYIECVKCGAKLKSLVCHLYNCHGWTGWEYRIYTGLPEEIPLVCGSTSRNRRETVKKVNKKRYG